MTNPIDVLNKIHSSMFMKQMEVDIDEDTDLSFNDVPDVGEDDEEYKTNMKIPSIVEQDEEEDPNEKKPEPTNSENPEETPPQEDQPAEEPPPEDPEMSGEEGVPQEETDLGEEGESSPEEIGRVFELKKIYSRLTSIESYLSDSSDLTLLKLRNYVSQAIELFEILIANIKSFMVNIDEIIIIYYKFIEIIYGLLNKYYEERDKELEDKGGVSKFN